MGNEEKQFGLVADIGGTNGRFALVRAGGTEQSFELIEQRDYLCSKFDSFAAMAERYLSDCGQSQALPAVIAVAGPVEDNRCAMTNCQLIIDGGQLQKQGVFSSCQVVNDFAALASSLPILSAGDLMQIGPHGHGKSGAMLVVGPGTGLGAAFLTKNGSSYVVLEGEGGHMAFAPCDELEVEILRWFGKKYDRVSVERILSGSGLVDLHEALASIDGRGFENLSAEEIMKNGLLEEGAAQATLSRFCAILGSFAGDLALAGGCWHGIYIGGGILPRMPELLAASPFRQRFEAKGRFAEKMRQIPSWLITCKTPALLGAASRLPVL
jgi:glucokinase